MSYGRMNAEWRARAEACYEAAEHLGLAWTDDLAERRQGIVVADWLRKRREACLRMADARERRDVDKSPNPS